MEWLLVGLRVVSYKTALVADAINDDGDSYDETLASKGPTCCKGPQVCRKQPYLILLRTS